VCIYYFVLVSFLRKSYLNSLAPFFSVYSKVLNVRSSVEKWINIYKILELNRNNVYQHFCFSELLILRERKVSQILFLAKKNSKKYWKIPFRRVAQKSTNLHQTPLTTLFWLTHYYSCISLIRPATQMSELEQESGSI